MRPTLTEECISVVVPVYNEGENIQTCLRGLYKTLGSLKHEILICYDFDADTTLPAIEAMPDKPPTVRTIKNTLGAGVAFAMRAGFQAARGDVVVTTMADLSDPPDVIPLMAEKIRVEGADVVAGSRYMRGGSQIGGPRFKGFLSRAAGLTLHCLAGLRTHDATNNFRAYSRRLLDGVRMESVHGFEVGLELTVKAHLKGMKIAEVPSRWFDRRAGQSRFRLWKWLPRYLRWYWAAMAAPALVYGLTVLLSIVDYFLGGQISLLGADTAAALVFVVLTRSLKRRTVVWDTLFPLAWLHPGHALLGNPVLLAVVAGGISLAYVSIRSFRA